ncbi:MAG: hypothetical protein AAGG75_23620 [Bacteroidota bacterium]
MWAAIRSKLQQYSQVAGVELKKGAGGQELFELVLLQREKQNISIVERHSAIESLEQLSSHIPSGTPVALTLNGRGILHKRISSRWNEPEEALLSALPNAKLDELCYQIHQGEGGQWVSILRKTILDNWLEGFARQGLTVVQLSLGPFGVEPLLPLLQFNEGTLHTGLYDLELAGGAIRDFREGEGQRGIVYSLANEPLANELLPAFAGGFQAMAGLPPQLFNDEALQDSANNYLYNRLFKLLGWGMLIGIFAILLFNFMAFNWLNTKNQQLSLELAYHQQQLSQLDTLKKQYAEKQSFLSQSNVLESSRLSYYADQIGLLLPSELQLTALRLSPPRSSSSTKREAPHQFDPATIIIKGLTRRPQILNAWIKTLESRDWVKEVSVQPYSENNEGLGAFELSLKIASN